MSFADECKKADGRYRAGKDPVHIDAEHWALTRGVQAKLRRGSIPPSWDRPEWGLERLYWYFQDRAEQARLRERVRVLGVRPTSARGGGSPRRDPAGEG